MDKLCPSSPHPRGAEDRAGADQGGDTQLSGVTFDPTWMRKLPAKLAGSRGAVAALGLIGAALSSPSHAQAPPLGRRGASGSWPTQR